MLGPMLGGLGAVGGALGGVALAGKYAPAMGKDVLKVAKKVQKGTGKRLKEFAKSMPEGVKNAEDLVDAPNFNELRARLASGLTGASQNISGANINLVKPIVDTAIPGMIGATAGGVVLGAVGNAIDPEQYGPSNTQNSLYQMQGDLSRMM